MENFSKRMEKIFHFPPCPCLLCGRHRDRAHSIMKNQDIRWIQRFRNYQQALSRLTEAVVLSRQRP